MANATGAPTDEVVPGETGAEDGCIYFTMEDASRWCKDQCGMFSPPGTLHVVVGEQWVPCTGVPHDANAPYSEMTAAPHVGAAAQHHSGETVDAAGCVYWTEYTAQGPVQWCRDVVGVFGPTGIEYSSADGETWFADSEAWLALTDEAIALLAKPTRAELRKQAKGSRGAEDQRRSGGWSKGQHGERWVRGWGEREGNASRTRGQTGAAKEEWWTRASGPAKSLAESGDSLAASASQQAGTGGAAAGRDGAPVAAEVQDDTSVWKSSVQADRARIYGAAGAVVVAQLEAQVDAAMQRAEQRSAAAGRRPAVVWPEMPLRSAP